MSFNQYQVGRVKMESPGVNDGDVRIGVTAQEPGPSTRTDDHNALLLNKLAVTIGQNTDQLNKVSDLLTTMKRHYDENNDTEREKVRSDRVIVELKVTYLKIVDIVTVNQHFETEVFIQAKWEEPWLHGKSLPHDASNQDIDDFVPWDPKLILVNIDGALHVNKKSFDVKFNEPGYMFPVVYQLWRVKGFFKENLELEHFPFDIQDLTISISTDRTVREVNLVEDQKALSSVNTRAFMDSQEWQLYKHVESFRSVSTVEYGSSKSHPMLNVQCRVARKIAYYMWNIAFIMVLIIVMTIAGHQVPFDNSDRLVITVTLFLTAVTFKLVVKSSLPTLSYLTYLDVWVLGCLVFLVLQATQNAFMVSICHFMVLEDITFIDMWSMLGLTLLFFVGNLLYIFYVHNTSSERRILMEDKDRIYKDIKKYLEIYGKMPPKMEHVNFMQ